MLVAPLPQPELRHCQPGQRGSREPARSSRAALLPAYFSLSPSHFDIRSEEDTEKKVELLASVATALAK